MASEIQSGSLRVKALSRAAGIGLTKIIKLILNKQWPDPVSNKFHRLFQ